MPHVIGSTSEYLLDATTVTVLSKVEVLGLQVSDLLVELVDDLVVLVMLVFQKLETFLLLVLLRLCFFTRSANGVVVLGALGTILRVDTFRFRLDSILSRLSSRSGLAESKTVGRIMRLIVGGGVVHIIVGGRLALDNRLSQVHVVLRGSRRGRQKNVFSQIASVDLRRLCHRVYHVGSHSVRITLLWSVVYNVGKTTGRGLLLLD